MHVGNNNNNWQTYLQHDHPGYSSPTNTPSNPRDVFTGATSSSSPVGIQNMIGNNPDLREAWENLSPQEQQELNALFSGQGTHAGHSSSGGFTQNWHPHQDSYDGSTTHSGGSTPSPTPTQSSSSTQNGGTTHSTGSTGSPGEVYGDKNPGASDPSITLKNDSSTTRYYFIQASAGSDPENLNNQVIAVPPGSSATLNPGVGFNGAITDNGTNSTAACLGTRMEFNASGSAGVFYDADTQYGNTNATFGATDGSGVLEGDGDLQHYITAGAVQGQSEDAADKYSDKSSTSVTSNKFTLTSLDYKPGEDGGNDYSEAQDPNKTYNIAYANGDGSVIV